MFFGVERVAVNCCGVDDTTMSVEMVITPDNREELCNLHGLNDEASRSKVRKIRKAQVTNSKESEHPKP